VHTGNLVADLSCVFLYFGVIIEASRISVTLYKPSFRIFKPNVFMKPENHVGSLCA
jgi:hypothetical protein